MRVHATALIVLLLGLLAEPAGAQGRGWRTDILRDTFGYDAEDLAVPIEQVQQGCGQRDCIPAIDQPQFMSVKQAGYLRSGDIVLGVVIDGQARAYPSKVLDRHEIVNDVVADKAIAITYCPLCGSGLAFSREIDGSVTTLGVSGLLRNSDLIIYDRATRSLWQQVTGAALAGPHRGKRLVEVPLSMTTWRKWREAHPDTQVLKPPRGARNYSQYPYGDYEKSTRVMFPVSGRDTRLHPKRVVFGLEIGDSSIAFEQRWLEKNPVHQETIGGTNYTIQLHQDGHVTAQAGEGEPLSAHRLFWFAWFSFHPDTELRR